MSTASRKEDRQAAQQPPATGAWKVLLDECQRYMLPRDWLKTHIAV
jgi:hypothetical protein